MIARLPIHRLGSVTLCALAIALLSVAEVSAQNMDSPAAPDSAAVRVGVSPTGAFLRAVLVPGWGHASIGARTRAGFYFVLEATSGYGILRTRRRISEARNRADFREPVIRAELADQGIVEVDAIQEVLDADPTLEDLTALTESRLQQQEDWAALGIFLLFLSGADAYVSSHLKDFPAPIEFEASPVGNGRMDVGFKIPVGN